MPRIHLADTNALDPVRAAFDDYAPEIGTAALAFSHAAYRHSLLSLRELEGARYRTAQINGCIACQAFRGGRDIQGVLDSAGAGARARTLGRGDPPTDEFYAAVGEAATSPLFSDRERLAIELAERMGEQPHSMTEDDRFWNRLHAAFTDREIVDMTLSIASWIALGRTVHTLELDTVCMMALVDRESVPA